MYIADWIRSCRVPREQLAFVGNDIDSLAVSEKEARGVEVLKVVEAIVEPEPQAKFEEVAPIEFAVGGNTYYLDTEDFEFTKGCEHTYTITLNRTGVEVSGATISNWGTGEVADDGELDASDLK